MKMEKRPFEVQLKRSKWNGSLLSKNIIFLGIISKSIVFSNTESVNDFNNFGELDPFAKIVICGVNMPSAVLWRSMKEVLLMKHLASTSHGIALHKMTLWIYDDKHTNGNK